MNTHADKSQNNSSRSVANEPSRKREEDVSVLQPEVGEAESSRGIDAREMADNSPQVAAQASIQRMANARPGASAPISHPAVPVQKMQEEESEEETELPVQQKTNETGLPDNLKAGVEGLSGIAMDDVRVHRNSDKPAALKAKAYAQGTDIHVGPGQEQHLAHEAWHVVQQKQGRVQATRQMKGGVGVNDDEGLESEADMMGAKAMQFKAEPTDAAEPRHVLTMYRPSTIQRKGEFKTEFEKNPEVAKAAVKSNPGPYVDYQTKFETKFGAGLFTNQKAIDGANTMLAKMKAAMEGAGMKKADVTGAFAVDGASKKTELGGVLADSVDEAIASGNLREKMGMVYQARFEISKALDALLSLPMARVPLGDEMKSVEMAEKIRLAKENAKPVSYAILTRRPSVSGQLRDSNADKKKWMTEDVLKEMGVPLSEREKLAATPQSLGGKRAFTPGSEYYKVNEGTKKAEQDKLRRVLSGLSGSTDMYFNIAKHLNMSEAERKGLRLAALGQMLTNNDHSFHEIMHVAKTQGGLTDYPDDLPIGYTHLDPLSGDEIIATSGLPDFPGDAQVRESKTDLKSSVQVRQVGGNAAWKAKRYPAILAKLDAYHTNPKTATLTELGVLIDSWTQAKKPAADAWNRTKKNWESNTRRIELEKLKNEVLRLIAQQDVYLQLDLRSAKLYILDEVENAPQPKKGAAKNKMLNFITEYIAKITVDANLGANLNPELAGAKLLAKKTKELEDIRTYINTSDLPSQGKDLRSKEFRASNADLDLKLDKVDVKAEGVLKKYGDDASPAKGDLPKLLTDGVIESRRVMERLGKNVSGIPDLEPPRVYDNAFAKRRGEKSRTDEIDGQIAQHYTANQQDFLDNIDTSMLDALKPGTAIETLLRKIEGHPMPAELQALQAYAQPGFFKLMNGVMNKIDKPEFIAQVPDQLMSLIKLATSGLRKMKPYTAGSAYRGDNRLKTSELSKVKFLPKRERQAEWDRKFRDPDSFDQFLSTSKRAASSYIVKDNKWRAVEIRNIKTGVDISAISNTMYEREVLFPPGTKFNVLSVEDKFTTSVKGVDDKVTQTDVDNRYNEAPINFDQPGRLKVVVEEA